MDRSTKTTEDAVGDQTPISWQKKIASFYVSDQFLGRGEYSEVLLGCFVNNLSKKVAVKVVKKSVFQEDPYIMMTLERQYKMLKDIKHENIVQFYDMFETPRNWYFFFEFCNQGTLEDYIRRKNGKLSESKALLILMEICEGFKELYKLNIMHRDLKPANVMISDGVIKISDFSFAKVLSSGDKNEPLQHSLVGTPFYTPLQILEAREYSSKCDIWSLGVMFYQMLFGRFPFVWKALANDELKDGGINKLTEAIKKNNLDYPVGIKISKDLKLILEKTLGKEEDDRISWVELFEAIKKLDFSALSNVEPKAEKQEKAAINDKNEPLMKSNMHKIGMNSKEMSFLHSQLKGSQKLKGDEIALDQVLAKINQKIAEAEKSYKKSYHQSQNFKVPGSQRYKSPHLRKDQKETNLLMDMIRVSDDEDNIEDEEMPEELDEGSTNLEIPTFVSPNVMLASDKKLSGYNELEVNVGIMNEYLYFKRNIANFLDKVVQRIWQGYNMKKFTMNVQEFYQVMFCLIKYECMILESIDRILTGKEILDFKLISEDLNNEKTETLFAYYKKSTMYRKLLEIITGDLNFRKNCYLKEIYETLRISVGKDPKKYKQNFIEVLNLDLSEDKKLIAPLSNCLKTIYEVIYKESLSRKKDKEMLILLKCVILAFSPFDDFIWDPKKKKPHINFEEFFKKLEDEKSDELIEYINGKDLSVLQVKLKNKFSAFVNSARFL